MGANQLPTHRIRLRGPWRYRPLQSGSRHEAGAGQPFAGPLPSPGTCTVPTTWQAVFADRFYGRARFERSFGCPTGLGPGDSTILQIQGFERPLHVRLNGATLDMQTEPDDVLECDVSGLLRPRNELSLDIEFAGGADRSCPIGAAELLIRSAG